MSEISKYLIDYTEKAKKGELTALVGRSEEINRLVHILLREAKNNPLIVGPSGIGKTALVEGLAAYLISEQAPEALKNKHIVGVDVATIMLDTKNDEEYAQRLKEVFEDIYASQGQKILYTKDVSFLVRTDVNPENIEAAKFLKLKVMEGTVNCIMEADPLSYREYIK